MRGEVTDEESVRRETAHDTSLFERMPELVVYPEDAADVTLGSNDAAETTPRNKRCGAGRAGCRRRLCRRWCGGRRGRRRT